MLQLFMAKYRLSGGRTKTIVMQAENEEVVRRHVCDLVTSSQVENNLFVNLDFVQVEPYNG